MEFAGAFLFDVLEAVQEDLSVPWSSFFPCLFSSRAIGETPF